MSFTKRDKAKVNAGLAMIHDAGYDASEVADYAAAIINTGTPARQAYERAFNQFVANYPSLHAPLQRIGQLIDATDERTLASYNVSLERFLATGEEAHLAAILPTVTQDMAEMARRTGDAGFADYLPDNVGSAPPSPSVATVESFPAGQPQSRPGWGPEGFRAAAPAASCERGAA